MASAPAIPAGSDALRAEHEAALFELLRIPSVSADSRHKPDVARAADWVEARLRGMGLAVERLATPGAPILFAQSPPVPGKPVALVYGHYDVQPPDPLGEWLSPPFEPTVRDGNVYARGATDDKGQMLTHVLGVESLLKSGDGTLPIQVKFLIEGEEEVGSEHLEGVVAASRDKLACDVVVVSDSSQFAPGVPAVTYGLRGLVCYEIAVVGPVSDQHSGAFGGALTNPANVVAKLLASLSDDFGRVAVPGFYDDVVEPTEIERRRLAALPFSEAEYFKRLGVSGAIGEKGYSVLERRWLRPAFDVNGIYGGYQGEGSKTVLPARAGAKFSFRLAPDQDPGKVTSALTAHLHASLPVGVHLTIDVQTECPAYVAAVESPYCAAAFEAIRRAFGREPVATREGGSIPILGTLSSDLGADVLMLGWGLDDDGMHGPNEKFSLSDFHRGVIASAELWRLLSSITPPQGSE